jgi:hypothetical protein
MHKKAILITFLSVPEQEKKSVIDRGWIDTFGRWMACNKGGIRGGITLKW